jgi:serine protease Do
MMRVPFQILASCTAVLLLLSPAIAAQDSDIPTASEVIAACQPTIVKLFGAGGGSLDSYGTGILISSEGHVLTVWNHLISSGYLTAVTFDGRRFQVETLGTSSEVDAALLRLKSDDGETFPFVDLKVAIDPEPGTSVLAFSNMFRVAAGNEPVTVVHGVIAAKVPLEASQGRWTFPVKSPVWLIDAITNNSGSAGGLLTDLNGRPVGLIGREIRHSTLRTWANYAVPLTTLAPIAESLRSGRKTEVRPKDAAEMVTISDQELTSRFGLTLLPNVIERTPAFVDRVVLKSVADTAGFRRGDLIVLANDFVITSVTDFQQQLATYRTGTVVVITVNRDQQLLPLEIRVP